MPRSMLVKDHMATEVVALQPDMEILRAAQVLISRDMSGAPVLGELRLFDAQELQALFVYAALKLDFALRQVFEMLFAEPKRVRVRLDADLDRTAGLVCIDVVQRRSRDAALCDDAVDDPIGRCVVAALEAAQIEDGDVRVTRSKLRGPNFLRGVGSGHTSLTPRRSSSSSP